MEKDNHEKFVFGSERWINRLRRELHLAAQANPWYAYSHCTVITNVPEELGPDPSGTIAYVFRVDNGTASLEYGETSELEVDAKTVYDYETALMLATMHYDLSSEACITEISALHKSLQDSGRFLEFRNKEFTGEAATVGLGIHNSIAAVTIPPNGFSGEH